MKAENAWLPFLFFYAIILLPDSRFPKDHQVHETRYVINLSPDGKNRYRHYHVSEKGQIIEFRIQYEAYLEGRWRAIVRYDTAHGFAHRDVMHPNGTQTKTSFQPFDFATMLTYGERDLKRNWASYCEDYIRDMRRR